MLLAHRRLQCGSSALQEEVKTGLSPAGYFILGPEVGLKLRLGWWGSHVRNACDMLIVGVTWCREEEEIASALPSSPFLLVGW